MTTTEDRWLLPEGIEELLPADAARIEQMRRQLIDLYASWGYELVIPPLIEYLDSLLTGTGNDLDLQTFKITDQLTGRLMGIRADMTPQVARIEAHGLHRQVPTRLCYIGSVLTTRPGGFSGTRCPLQAGIELYGYADVAGDIEVLNLMQATLTAVGISDIHIDLGHVGIFRGLAAQAGLSADQENELFAVLQRKASHEISAMLDAWDVPAGLAAMFVSLVELDGDADVLDRARTALRNANDDVANALDALAAIAAQVRDVSIHFDLAELRGYKYHTGAVFAAYVPGHGEAIAAGGRYDNIGKAFGYARPATGFSADLKTLLALADAGSAAMPAESRGSIFAPCIDDDTMRQRVAELREAGEQVICALPGQQGNAADMGCDRHLVRQEDQWQVVAL